VIVRSGTFSSYAGFSALRAKKEPEKTGSTMLPQAKQR
jgi:hypothetical protein